MRMMRCKAEITIHPTGTELREDLWPGKEVDFDRVLVAPQAPIPSIAHDGDPTFRPAVPAKPAFTVADAVAGLEHCFEPVTTDVSAGPARPAHTPEAEE